MNSPTARAVTPPPLVPSPADVTRGLLLGALGVALFAMTLPMTRLAVGDTSAPQLPPAFVTAGRAAVAGLLSVLYLLLVLQAFGGWLANSAYGAPTPFFGLFELPALRGKDQAFAEQIFSNHRIFGFVIAGLAAMHIAAALHHYLIKKDRVLQRMLPRALGGD